MTSHLGLVLVTFIKSFQNHNRCHRPMRVELTRELVRVGDLQPVNHDLSGSLCGK